MKEINFRLIIKPLKRLTLFILFALAHKFSPGLIKQRQTFYNCFNSFNPSSFLAVKLSKIIFSFLLLFAGCSSSSEVTIISRSGWSAVDPKPYKAHIPERITIHHEGTIFNVDENAPHHIKSVQVWGMGKDRSWSDIPYHFLIDPKGNIYEGRNVFTEGETATDYNPNAHLLISCLGNFEEQEVSEAQLDAMINLIAHCCKKYQISPETIASHKDYSNQTVCPGKNLYKYLQNGFIKNEVKKLLN